MQTILSREQRKLLQGTFVIDRRENLRLVLYQIKPRSGFSQWFRRMKLLEGDNPFSLGYRAAQVYLRSGKTTKYPRCPYKYGTFESKRWCRGYFTFENEYYES